MLVIPDTSPLGATLIGHDPGSDTLGVGIVHFDILSLDIIWSDAFTLKGKKLGRGTWETEIQGDMIGRVWALEEELLNLYCRYQPVMFGSESAYVGKFAGAGLVLMRVICSIQNAVRRYDRWKTLEMFEPSVVKNAVGAKGNTKKDPVREGILRYPGLHFCGETALTDLDEHACDGLAVTLALLQQLRKEAGL